MAAYFFSVFYMKVYHTAQDDVHDYQHIHGCI